jgi:hypothetical protein
VVWVGSEYLQRDGSIVTCTLQLPHRAPQVYRAGAERKMQIGRATFVVVQMDMPEPGAVGTDQLVDRAPGHQQVGVPDVQVKPQLGQRVQQLAQISSAVEVSWQILDHESHAALRGIRLQLRDGLDVSANEETPVVHRRMVVGVEVHPASADRRKGVHTAPELDQCRPADLLDAAGYRKVKGGMADDAELVTLQGAPDGISIDFPGGGAGRLEGEVDKLETHAGDPLDFLKHIAARVVHRTDLHITSTVVRTEPGPAVE